jgi:hypothetical protein
MMMSDTVIEGLRKTLLSKVPPEARRLVLAWFAQELVASEIRMEAIKAGASPTVLDMARALVPIVASRLEELSK